MQCRQQPPRRPSQAPAQPKQAGTATTAEQLAAPTSVPQPLSREADLGAAAREREGEGGAPPPLPLPSPAAQAIEGVQQQWASLAGKYKLVLATSLSFVICNMDKGGCWLPVAFWVLAARAAVARRLAGAAPWSSCRSCRRPESAPSSSLPSHWTVALHLNRYVASNVLRSQHLSSHHPNGPRLWLEPHSGR